MIKRSTLCSHDDYSIQDKNVLKALKLSSSFPLVDTEVIPKWIIHMIQTDLFFIVWVT